MSTVGDILSRRFTPLSRKTSPEVMPEPPMPSTNPQLKRVTTSVLSKHHARGSITQMSNNSSRRGIGSRKDTDVRQYNPSLRATSIREEQPRAKSVNTQT